MHPVQSDCDPYDPNSHAAWCWAAGIPDPSPVRPLPIPLIGPMLVAGVSKMLWGFGFRHHEELQTVWIEGTAGLGAVAKLVENKPVDDFANLAEKFLSDNNPDLLNTIRNADPAEREELLKSLESNFESLRGIIDTLKDI